MTNLEWIRTLSEEEFADWLYGEWLHHLQYRWSSSRGGLIIWLKDRKTEPTISKMEQVDESQTETKTETKNSNLTFEKVMEETQAQVIEFPDTHQKFIFTRKIEMDGDSIKICGWEYKGVKDED